MVLMTRTAILALAIGLIACACSGRKKTMESDATSYTEAIEQAIETHIQDEERAQRLLRLQGRVEATTERFFAGLERSRKSWMALNADYSTTPQRFDVLQRASRDRRRSAAGDLIRAAMEARRVVTREEWNAMAADVKKAVR